MKQQLITHNCLSATGQNNGNKMFLNHFLLITAHVTFTDTDACYVLCFFLLLASHKARRRNGNLTAGKCASCMREEGWRGHITEPCHQNQISVDRNRVIFSFRYSILKFII